MRGGFGIVFDRGFLAHVLCFVFFLVSFVEERAYVEDNVL
jgi:hypothetical protein